MSHQHLSAFKSQLPSTRKHIPGAITETGDKELGKKVGHVRTVCTWSLEQSPSPRTSLYPPFSNRRPAHPEGETPPKLKKGKGDALIESLRLRNQEIEKI